MRLAADIIIHGLKFVRNYASRQQNRAERGCLAALHCDCGRQDGGACARREGVAEQRRTLGNSSASDGARREMAGAAICEDARMAGKAGAGR